MHGTATALPAIPLGHVVQGDRVRFGVGFDVRGQTDPMRAGEMTLWLDLGPACSSAAVEVREPSSGIDYTAIGTMKRDGQRLGVRLNAAAFADLRRAAGAFFTVEGEFRLADHPASSRVVPRFHQLTIAVREEDASVAA